MPGQGSAAGTPAGQASVNKSGGAVSKRGALRSTGLSAPRRQQWGKVLSKTSPKRRWRSNGGVVSRKPRASRRDLLHTGGSTTVGCHAANESNRVCPICREAYTAETFPVISAPCGHVTCASCSVQWLQKKKIRTCAFCRAPVLSVVECPLLERLLEVPRPTPSEEPASLTPMQESLRGLSQGDLNLIPDDYREHMIHRAALRAIRKGSLPILEAVLNKWQGRPSNKMFCHVAGLWKKDPKPVLAMLLARGGRITGDREDAPILNAVYYGRFEMATLLLDHSADPGRACDGMHGATALHVAARRGRLEHVELLLQRGAPVDVKDDFGRTPMTLAKEGQRMHASGCNLRECWRCDARGQIRTALSKHAAKEKAATRRRAAVAALRGAHAGSRLTNTVFQPVAGSGRLGLGRIELETSVRAHERSRLTNTVFHPAPGSGKFGLGRLELETSDSEGDSETEAAESAAAPSSIVAPSGWAALQMLVDQEW